MTSNPRGDKLGTPTQMNKPNPKATVDELVTLLLKRGGRVNKSYLRKTNQNKHALVYLKGWFGGKNVKEALIKALSLS